MPQEQFPSLDLLTDLLAAPSPSGFEQPAQAVFRASLEGVATDIRTDLLGNTYATVNAGGSIRAMLAGHCDEIGFIVTHVHDKGYLHIASIGGHDATIVVGQRVLVHTATGTVPGVIGRKPIHLMDEDERGKKLVLHDLFVDIGATGFDAVAAKVSIGDPITYSAGFERLEGDLAVSHNFDDKIGAFVVAETLRTLAKDPWRTKLTAEVVGVSTVQEEIGLRGARTSAYSAQPTVGIAIDVTHASDYPGVDKKRVGNVRLGHGPVLTRGANINPEVYRILLDVAQKQGIPLQFEAHGGGTGTDANAMQLNQAGMATGLVSIPLRYMHTPCEVASLSDIRRTIDLLVAFLCEIKGTTDFTPTMANLRPPHTGISPSLSKDEVDS